MVLRYFHPLYRLERQRSRYLKNIQLPETIARCINAPLPEKEQILDTLSFVALDIETTGLDTENDQILSMGWIEINNQLIDLSRSKHMYIKDATGINSASVVINHITPEQLEEGISLDDAFETLFKCIEGKILLAHGCMVEKVFLDRYIKEKYNLPPLPLVWLDTLALEKSFKFVRGVTEEADLRLGAIRDHYGLPEYNAHNALADSISCAELFLVQVEKFFANEEKRFYSLYPAAQKRSQQR